MCTSYYASFSVIVAKAMTKCWLVRCRKGEQADPLVRVLEFLARSTAYSVLSWSGAASHSVAVFCIFS